MPNDKAQGAKFKAAARELGCDESEERFTEALRKIRKQKVKEKDESATER